MKTKILALLVAGVLVVGAYFWVDYYNKNIKVVSNYYVDVNPSIKLSTNSTSKVVKAETLNNDGEVILKDLDLIGKDALEAMNLITDKLISEGYLAGDGANILLTVENNDLEKAKELETAMTEAVNKKLEENYIAGTLLTQVDTVRKNIPDEIKTIMDTYDISYSKAVFINNVIKKDTTLKVEDLASLKISEISKLINDNKIDMSNSVKGTEKLYQKELDKTLEKAQSAVGKASEEATKAAVALEAETKTSNQGEEQKLALENAYKIALEAKQKAEDTLSSINNAYEETKKATSKAESSSSNSSENGSTTNGNSSNSSGSNSTTNGNSDTSTGNGSSSQTGNTNSTDNGSGSSQGTNSNR